MSYIWIHILITYRGVIKTKRKICSVIYILSICTSLSGVSDDMHTLPIEWDLSFIGVQVCYALNIHGITLVAYNILFPVVLVCLSIKPYSVILRLFCLFLSLSFLLGVLCFDHLTLPKMPFRVTHRKEVTHSNGSYERKSLGRKFADEMERGKKNPIILS